MNQSIISHSLIAILFFAVGLGLGYASFADKASYGFGASSDISSVGSVDRDSINSSEPKQTNNEEVSTAENAAVTVSSDNLTDGQRALAEAMGIDPNNVTITPEMIACAEAKLGSSRVNEITNGATPSFGEGVKLAGCYASN